MNRKMRRFMRDLEKTGARVFISKEAPDEVTAAFVEKLMECPDCQEEIERARRRAKTLEH